MSRKCTRGPGIDQPAGPAPIGTLDSENAGRSPSSTLAAYRCATGARLGSTRRHPSLAGVGTKRTRCEDRVTTNRSGIYRPSSNGLRSLASVHRHAGVQMDLGLADRPRSGDGPSGDSRGRIVSGRVRSTAIRVTVSHRLLVGATPYRIARISGPYCQQPLMRSSRCSRRSHPEIRIHAENPVSGCTVSL